MKKCSCGKEFETDNSYVSKCVECRYMHLLPEFFLQKDYYKPEQVRKYINKNIYLCGASNAGKTVFLIEVLKQSIRDEVPAEYVNLPELLAQIRYADDKQSLVNEWKCKKHMILFDEIAGVGKVTEFVLDILYQIVDYRHIHCLPSCFTSNLTLDKISISDLRIANRIERICGEEIYYVSSLDELKTKFSLIGE